MTFEQVLGEWESPDREGDLVHLERQPERGAIHAPLDPPLHPLLQARLAERGIDRLYRHQVRMIRSIRQGDDTVIVAGTSAGKTLGFQVPIIESLLADTRNSALLIYPTKALAQDQLRSLRDFRLPEIVATTYDGDTPNDERLRARRKANVILTNPDMLHVGILPGHDQWGDFLHRLRFVVVDEMHTLRGIFGTHVAMVLRRLRRLCANYGSDPVFVFGSATIGNPEQLALALSGKPVHVIDEDTSPRGAQSVVLWNPPVTDPDLNRRRSALSESTDLFCDLVGGGHNTIAFTRSRKGVELMFRWATDRLPDRDSVAPYRAGYLPEQRRQIEQRLFAGTLRGVIATNALELGIDVGGLEAAVLTTFPGTISSFRQQSGRAGRRQSESLVVLVGGEDALDQYFMTHPRQLFDRPPEAVMINPSNPMILEAHAACAAHEIPLGPDDARWFGPGLEEAAARLVEQGLVKVKEGALYWVGRRRPASMIDLRSGGGGTFVILAGGEALGTLDSDRVYREGHEGAVYLQQGDTYVVDSLDLDRREVRVRPAAVDYYTQPKTEKYLEIIDERSSRRIGPVRHTVGVVRVESHVLGYQKRRLGTSQVLDTIPLDFPPTTFETDAIWLTIPPPVLEAAGLDHHSTPGALHAAEHAGIGMMPLLAVCDRWDIGGLSTNWHPQTGNATIFIYEGYPGGAGISGVAFARGVEHLSATVEAIRGCPCLTGCPSCVQSPKCGNFNEPLDKEGAIRLLDVILESESTPAGPT